MKACNKQKPDTIRRWISILMMVSLLFGSVSMASFAKGTGRADRDWRFGADVSGYRTKGRSGRSETATPSGLSRSRATSSNAVYAAITNTLGDLLEQTDDSGAITADWFRVMLDDTVISDSDDYSKYLKPGTRIQPDAMVEHRLRVKISPRAGDLGEGDTVTWNLGRVEGLNLPEETWEELPLYGIDIGCVCLSYTEDGTLYLTTEFYDDVQQFGSITVTYWFESTFIPVEEETVLEFDLPVNEELSWAVLLPEEREETSTQPIETTIPKPTTPEPTTPEETNPTESSPAETTSEESTPAETTTQEQTLPETTAEETTTQETTAEETTVPETTKGSGRKSSGGGSSVSSVKVTSATETAAAEEPTATAEEPTALEAIENESTAQMQEPADEVPAVTGDRPGESDAAGRGTGSGRMAVDAVEAVMDQVVGQQAGQHEDVLKLDIVEAAGGQSQLQPGELIVYRMAVSNEGTEIIKDIRVRDYLPDYTSFVAVEDGSYGVINGRQHVTWMLDQLKPGEEKELVLSVRVFPCVPENYKIENQVFWQADNKTQTNDPENPSEVKSLPAFIVG